MRTTKTTKNKIPGKPLIYETLCAMNRSFEQVLQDLERLQQLGLFRGHRFLKSCQLAVRETRAWTNLEVLEILRDREESDWARFGRLRSAREKALGDPRDVPIEAERLRRRSPRKKAATNRTERRK